MTPRRADGFSGATQWVRVGRVLALAGFIFTGGLALLSGAEEPVDASAGPSVAERVFFGRLDELVQTQRWPEAARHIQQLQALRNEPEWLVRRAGELRLAQIQICRSQNDPAGALNAARLYLNGDDVRSLRLLSLAREMYAWDEKSSAIALVKEIVSRTPGFAPAHALLEDWLPARRASPLAGQSEPMARTDSAKAPPGRTTPPATERDEAATHLAMLHKGHAAGNLPEVIAAARLYLTGDRDRADKILEIARDLRAADEMRLALMLTREVVRRTPGYPPAGRYLAELEATVPKP